MMTFRAHVSRSALLLGLAVAAGCSDSPNTGASFAFNRPEFVELVCMDPGKSPDFRVTPLPMACCATDSELAEDEAFQLEEICSDDDFPGVNPVLHALVSQSTRGEVAGVDLEESVVLDSNLLIPGFNFVDVGGLPRAVVAPPERELIRPEDESNGSEDEDQEEPAKTRMGPPWTYVASAENQQVTAVATCRFREGNTCGPELAAINRNAEQRTRVTLAAAPRDMLLGPDDALWLTLPATGELARIPLSEYENDPFAMTEDRSQVLGASTYAIPAPTTLELEQPVVDDPAYVSTCGLGYSYQPVPTSLPVAPRVAGPLLDAPQPTRLRFDALSGLLFVADAQLPVLHVFRIESPAAGAEGEPVSLISLGALPTGAPVRDFVLTAEVPDVAPELFAMSAVPDTKRYLYAIDDRDGSLMAFQLTASPDGAALRPLAAPLGLQYRDRIQAPGVLAALEVVDNRGLFPEQCGVGTTQQQVADGNSIVEQLESQERRLRRQIEAAEDNADAGVAEADAGVDVGRKREELREVQQRLEIARTAGPRQLHGVFVVAVGLSGAVSVIDILDLDLYCREATSCENETDLVDTGSPVPVGVQRHAPRLSSVAQRRPVISAPEVLAGDDGFECENEEDEDFVEGYVNIDDEEQARACVPKDPWNQLDQTWSIETERAIPGLGIAEAAIADESDGVPGFESLADNQLILLAPAGIDLCARGLLANSPPPVLEGETSAEDAAVVDVISIVSEPPEHLRSECESPTENDEILVKIDEAYADRVVVSVSSDGPSADDLRRCYPDLLNFQVRTGTFEYKMNGRTVVEDEYLVSGTVTPYLHRVKTRSADGRCVIDEDLDPRLRSRARAGELFTNPYLAFRIPAVKAGQDQTRSLLIQVIAGRVELRETVFDPGATFADSLPASVRYFPLVNELFVVDSASQGLRRFTLSPFTRTGQIFR